jgi:hypothetical protein
MAAVVQTARMAAPAVRFRTKRLVMVVLVVLVDLVLDT